jgi:hypothetical protein
MATKKPSVSRPAPKARTAPHATSPRKLQNLAAKPQSSFDETIDDQLVDNSGVFRVTAAIAQAQTGHGEESTRFPNDSLVMAAQRDGFREEGPTLDEEVIIEAETTSAVKRQRLATLAARAARQQPRKR